MGRLPSLAYSGFWYFQNFATVSETDKKPCGGATSLCSVQPPLNRLIHSAFTFEKGS